MSPTPLAPRSFLEVPVNSEQGGWVVAEKGVPGRKGLGVVVGTPEPVFVYPTVHMCVVCGAYVCISLAGEMQCGQQW